ncbi:MAG: hypothetical protein Q9219_005310 [cf. Caloplaca sp. 3 TL-2023]
MPPLRQLRRYNSAAANTAHLTLNIMDERESTSVTDDELAQRQLQLGLAEVTRFRSPPYAGSSPKSPKAIDLASKSSYSTVLNIPPTTSASSSSSAPARSQPSKFIWVHRLLRPYAAAKRLLFYDLLLFYFLGFLIFLASIFIYLPYCILSYLLPPDSQYSTLRAARSATLLITIAFGIILLIYRDPLSVPSWSSSITDRILVFNEPLIDGSCAWAQRRIFDRQEYSALFSLSDPWPPPLPPAAAAAALSDKACVPTLCPSTLSFLHHPNPYSVLSFPSTGREPINKTTVSARLRSASRLFHPDKKSQHHLPDSLANGILAIHHDAAVTLLDWRKRSAWDQDEEQRIRKAKSTAFAEMDEGHGVQGLLRKVREKECRSFLRGQASWKMKEGEEEEKNHQGILGEGAELLVRWWRFGQRLLVEGGHEAWRFAGRVVTLGVGLFWLE